jgi:hypothetical protein
MVFEAFFKERRLFFGETKLLPTGSTSIFIIATTTTSGA